MSNKRFHFAPFHSQSPFMSRKYLKYRTKLLVRGSEKELKIEKGKKISKYIRHHYMVDKHCHVIIIFSRYSDFFVHFLLKNFKVYQVWTYISLKCTEQMTEIWMLRAKSQDFSLN